ncbi:MAG: hypothetical protein ABI765_16125 [Gemmatimonadota bacterium]
MGQTPAPSAPPPPPTVYTQVSEAPSVPFWMMMSPPALTIISLSVILGAVVVFLPLMRALGRRLEGKAIADPALTTELEQLRQRVGELEELPHHVAELEERLDFAERLLGQQREMPRIEQGS